MIHHLPRLEMTSAAVSAYPLLLQSVSSMGESQTPIVGRLSSAQS